MFSYKDNLQEASSLDTWLEDDWLINGPTELPSVDFIMTSSLDIEQKGYKILK
jgi:hypothetical protein